MRSGWWMMSFCLGLAMTGAARALPTEPDAGAIVRSQWRQATWTQCEAGTTILIADNAPTAEAMPLLRAIAAPQLLAEDAAGSADPIGCTTAAALDGTWLNPALMRLVSPLDLVQHYKAPKRRGGR